MTEDEILASALTRISQDNHSRFRTYVSEARFFYGLLERDLRSLPHGATILEVGSGSGLLSLLLAQSGYRVIAVEPVSSGFEFIHEIRDALSAVYPDTSASIHWIDEPLVRGSQVDSDSADYAFALNVVEHVPDMKSFFAGVLVHLKPQATLRVIHPNYAFPYEPHFGMPNLWSKSLTKFLFREKIGNSLRPNVWEFWDDLSWPTQLQVRRTLNASGYIASFSRDATHAYLSRTVWDDTFMGRKKHLAKLGRYSRVVRWAVEGIPIAVLPVVDCSIQAKTFADDECLGNRNCLDRARGQ